MKNKFKIKTNLKVLAALSFIIISVIITLVGVIYGINRIKAINNEKDTLATINTDLADFNAHNNRNKALMLKLSKTINIEDKNIILEQLKLNTDFIAQLDIKIDKELVDFPEMHLKYSNLKEALNNHAVLNNHIIDLIFNEIDDEALSLSLIQQDEIYENIRSEILAIEKYFKNENELLIAQTNKILKYSMETLFIIGLLIVFITILLSFSIIRLLNKISNNLKEGINILGTSSTEIQATVAEISTGTTETAAAIAETSTTIEEIRQTSMISHQKSMNLMAESKKATEYAEKGLESSQMMMDAMKEIEKQMKNINETILKLADQNRSIGEITTTVSDIADQSNLLAVNAAIEAAKAGEHGRGFNVVAQEIRSLSEQSKKSTSQVKGILNEIQKSAQQSVDVLKETNRIVEIGSRLVLEDRKVVEMLTETVEEAMQASIQISASSQQQMAGMDQIVPAMENIKQASEQNAFGMRQTQDAANNLFELSLNMKKILEKYQL